MNIEDRTRHVYLFGGLRVEEKGTPIPLRGNSKMGSLFVYLLLHPHEPHRREKLAHVLWPDAPPERIRRNLSDVLYKLRQALGPGWLNVERRQIALNVTPALWVDVHAFEQLVQTGEPEALAQAVALYTADLLPEIYEDWILAHRLALQERYLASLLQLGETAETHRHHEKAHRYYRQLINADPLREEAYRGLMRSLAGAGRTVEAVATYEKLETLLADELGVPPGRQTQELAQRLQSELKLKSAAQQQDPFVTPPFVGRVGERAQLLAALDQAMQGDGGIAIVLGESGIGKTRLVTELSQAADWRGWQVAWGHGQEFTLPPSYTPLRQALAMALPKPRIQQLAQLVQPLWLSLATPLLPQIAQLPNLPDLSQLTNPQEQLANAIYHLLEGLQQIAPHLFILDDVHWADTAVWHLLSELRPLLAQLRILVVISGRLQELRAQPEAWSALQAWDQAGATVLPLSGLTPQALQKLVAGTGQEQVTLQQLAHLHRSSGGNPLLAMALLETSGLEETKEQPTLAKIIQKRLATVSDTAQLSLQAAAVLGYRLEYSLWENVLTGLPVAELPELAGELERSRLLILEEEHYRFAHDTLRSYVYTNTPPERRRRLHQKALATLSEHQPADTLTLLYHARQAQEQSAIARYALQAGEQALANFNYQAATAYFGQALETLPADDGNRRYTAVRGRILCHDVLANREKHNSDLALLVQIAAQLDDPVRQADVAYLQTRYHWLAGNLEAAQKTGQQGLALARRADDRHAQARLLHALGQATRQQGAYDQARRQILQARQHYRSLGDRHGEAVTTDALGGLAWAAGDYQTAVSQHQTAAAIFHETGNLFSEAIALNNLGSAYWGTGEYDQARLIHERSLAINQELGHRRGESDNLDNLGGVAWVLGDYATAVDYYNQALAIRREMEDSWGISISLGNLGSAYRLMGDYDAALAYYAEALQVNRVMGRRRGEGYNQHGRGLTLLDAGKYPEAQQALEEARTIRTELGEHDNLLETVAGLGLVYVAEEKLAQAQTCLQEILARQDLPDSRAALRQWVHYAAFRICQALGQTGNSRHHLHQADAAMLEIAAPLPPPDQERFLQQVPLNQKIQAALEALSIQIQVRLVHAGVPLGRKLTEADYITVKWTLSLPEDEEITPATDRRRHILKRLLAEAEAQGATPTDADLADALQVSRRTILRDMEFLAQAGYTLPTRRRGS